MSRRFQFSLRALLIAVTVFCVWLAWHADRARRQRDAVKQVLSWGGNAEYERTERLDLLRNIIGDDYVANVIWVGLVADRATGERKLRNEDPSLPWNTDAPPLRERLAIVGHLTTLERLQVGWCEVDDAALLELKGLTRLHFLDLTRTNVSDDGLQHITGLGRLTKLWLRGTGITDRGVDRLKSLKNLRELDLVETQVSDAGVAELRQALPNCKVVR